MVQRFLIFIGVFLFAVGADARVFTSVDGATLDATIVAADVNMVTIRRVDGRLFKDVPLSRFSVEDRRYVRAWVQDQTQKRDNADLVTDAEIRVTFLKGKDDDFNNYGDIDDRVVKFEPEVVIDSQEKEIRYPDIAGTLVVIGENIMDKKQFAILTRQDFSLSALPRQKTRWVGQGFECRYDPDYGGFEYGGYLIVLRNRAGEIVMTKASKSTWESNAKLILKAKQFVGYDSSFSRESKLYTTFGLPR